MDDVSFLALAESATGYLDDRWGRPFAWALALATVMLPLGAVVWLALR